MVGILESETGSACHGVKRIFCNGRTSGLYFKKYQAEILGREAQTLPSTSPANAAWTMERLLDAWRVILESS